MYCSLPSRLRALGTFVIGLVIWLAGTNANAVREVEFRADLYQRDLTTNSLRGKGHAWVRLDSREVWADQLEVDLSRKIAIATGNVHIKEGEEFDTWCTYARYHLDGTEATLADATIISGQLVLTGATIEKYQTTHYLIRDGTYSNCNVDLEKTKDVSTCPLDWRLYGKRLDVTMEEYAHIYDAIGYVKQLPIAYTPYLVLPAKSKRQSGFLMPQISNTSNLGSGIGLPYYLVLGSWHDILISPTQYSKVGFHMGLSYRYIYSGDKRGDIGFSFAQRRFSDNLVNPAPNDPSKPRLFGVVGEWAINVRNQFDWDNRIFTRQVIQYVSNPYYTQDYARDLLAPDNLSYLRSQASAIYPHDDLLVTAQVQHHQSLIISKDSGVDKGAPIQLPVIGASHMTSPLVSRYLSYEWDTEFTNFARSTSFDQVPPALATVGTHYDADRSFDSNDYVRVGQRMRVEPRLIANVPMPSGLQFQPVFKAGSVGYHFGIPQSQLVHREYLEAEFPMSLYLSKTFETPFSGYERIGHVLQPRVIYALRPYQNLSSSHPFFCQDPDTGIYDPTQCRDTTSGLANPRFDLQDQFSKFEYMRFELINRFRRKYVGGIERFFLLQVSQQYNLRTFTTDPRFTRRLGPVELLSELSIWRITARAQASYDLETTQAASGQEMKENTLSGSIGFTSATSQDAIGFSTLLRNKADRTLTEQMAYLSWYKSLPTFFDLEGSFEYSMKQGDLLGYAVKFHFGSKPRSCWKVMLTTGRNSLKQPFVYLNFLILFGGAHAYGA